MSPRNQRLKPSYHVPTQAFSDMMKRQQAFEELLQETKKLLDEEDKTVLCEQLAEIPEDTW
eukprot:CAMPEP_0195511686 /NCGR_PEP_ID=MMETSP0794_2-20130614/3926_1 /TAXON_ID=515487 /ORGANISM="Stephanopyxis turris, Strain CCMP 815" /LENGTH=60 /DNA_ID=CAMNT_0040639339 /DNA_START=83 /DNA_END=262 /DNA_ORIENTATION=+